MFDGKTSPKGVDHKIIYEVWSQLFLKKGVGTGKYRKILTGLFLCRDICCSDFHFFKNDIDWGGHSEQHVSHCVEMPTLMPILNVWVWILAPLLIPASCWCVAERAFSSIASFPTCFQNRAEVRSWELNPSLPHFGRNPITWTITTWAGARFWGQKLHCLNYCLKC